MSTVAATDLIIVERSNTAYKCTKTDWDSGVSGGGGGGGGNSDGIVIKTYWCMNTAGYHASGQHKYHSSGSMFFARTDGSGCYTRSSTSTVTVANQRPNTKIKVDGTWYTLTSGTNISGATSGGPINMYYKRSTASWDYTNAEMTAAIGATSGSIQGVQFECSAPPSSSYNQFLNFGIALTTHNVTSTNTNYTSQTFSADNYSSSNYAYSTGWNTFNFSTTVSWS